MPKLSGLDWIDHFDPIGLILCVPPVNGGYWCTPVNSMCFACTGVDGTHFSFLTQGGQYTEASPVILTVPMSDQPNVVVGETLREFLALGYHRGYVALDQLVHDPSSAMAELESGLYPSDASDEELSMLHQLHQEFALRPWPNVRGRLASLRLRFASRLLLPDNAG